MAKNKGKVGKGYERKIKSAKSTKNKIVKQAM